MFEKVVNWIKGAINKMFNTTDIAKKFNIDISTSDTMINAIEEWAKIYNGQAPWLNEDVKSLNVAKTICERVAKAVTIEFKSQVEDETIDKIYQKFLVNLRPNVEYSLGKGGMFFKPFYSNGEIKIDCIHADKFIPTKFNSEGKLLGAIFIDQITKGDDIYTRLEYQDLKGNGLTIKNLAFKSEKRGGDLGKQIPLFQVEEWNEIQDQVTISNIDRLLGGYFKIPKANPIDNTSPIGVSIFANAITTLEEIDKQFSRTLWEYEAKEPAIDVDATAFKKDANGNDILPEGKERLYRRLDFGDEKTWNVYSPEIRDSSLFNGLNELLRQAESQCQLAFGVLSKQENIAKTATEIDSSKQDYYVTVSDIQGALQTSLDDLLYGIDVLMTLYRISHKRGAKASYHWDDSILVDTKEKRTQALVEKNADLIDDVQYFMETRDYSEEEAIAFVEKMQKRKQKEPIEKEELEE